MKLLRVHHVQVCIDPGEEALVRAREFYSGLLEIPEIEKPAVLREQGRPGFWLQLGDVQIHISCEDGVDRRATRAHVAYEVEDLDGVRARLASHGISSREGTPIPGFRRADLRDPFGNRIELLGR